MSTTIGPGRPARASRNASRMMRGSSCTFMTRYECFTMGSVIPKKSVSWNAILPMNFVMTWPVIATSGTESMYASAIAETRFVAPGPLVAMQTPTLPVARA